MSVRTIDVFTPHKQQIQGEMLYTTYLQGFVGVDIKTLRC